MGWMDQPSSRSSPTPPGGATAYAVTANGVYYTPDSIAMANNPALSWINITGNLPQLKAYSSNQFGSSLAINDPAIAVNNLVKGLTTIQADWRYVIPDDPTQPNGPTHPVLYVGGQAGVFRSTDNGQSWSIFPNIALDGSSQDGGYLPNASVTELEYGPGEHRPDHRPGPAEHNRPRPQ